MSRRERRQRRRKRMLGFRGVITSFNTEKIIKVVAGGCILCGIIAWIHQGSGKKIPFSSLPQVDDVLNNISTDTCLDEVMANSSKDKVGELQRHLTIVEILPSDIVIPSNGFESMKYVVKAGDTLSEIAERNNTTVERLKNDNNLDSDLINVDQELIVIPGIENILNKYENFDDLSLEEKNILLEQIAFIRTNSLNYIKNNANTTLLQLSMNNVKCKVLDAFGLNEDRYECVTINGQKDTTENSVSDILIEPFDIDKKGKKINKCVNLDDDLVNLQACIYNLQSNPILSSEDLTTKTLERIYNILKLNLDVMQKSAVLNEHFIFEDSVSLQKRK